MYRTLALVFVFALTACGGGGGGHAASALPAVPSIGAPAPASTTLPTGSTRVGNLVAKATFIDGAAPANIARRTLSQLRATKALNVSQVEVAGTFYDGAADLNMVTNKINVAPVDNTVPVSMSFSNVPAVNNAWVILSFTAIASDGSRLPLGMLGGLVDVTGGSTSTASFDLPSTQRLQVFLWGLAGGGWSLYDVNQSNLDAQIGSLIASARVAPSAATNLFGSSAYTALYNVFSASFERALVVSSDHPIQGCVVAPDPTKPQPVTLAGWKMYLAGLGTASPFGPQLPMPQSASGVAAYPGTLSSGAGLGTTMVFVPSVLQPSGAGDCSAAMHTLLSDDDALVFVYDAQHDYGIAALPAGHGGPTTLNVPMSAPTTLALNDPAIATFGAYGSVSNRINALLVVADGSLAGATEAPFFLADITGTSVRATPTIFGMPVSQFQLCSEIGQCVTIGSQSPIVGPPHQIYDDGQHLSYYGWSGADGSTSVSGSPYLITYAGTSAAIGTTTNAPKYALNGMYITVISSNLGASFNPTIAVSAVDSSGVTRTGSAPCSGGACWVPFANPSATWINLTSLNVTFTGLPSSATSLRLERVSAM